MDCKKLFEWVAEKEGKTVQEVEARYFQELNDSLRCEYCGDKGHKEKKCPDRRTK